MSNKRSSIKLRNKSTNFLLELDLDKTDNPNDTTTNELVPSSNKTQKFCTHFMKLLATFSFLIFWSIHVIGITPTHVSSMIKSAKKLKKSIFNPEKEEDKKIADPESVMILGPPWNFMRDVVMELPVFDEDATFLWETRDSSGPTIKKMLKKCFDLSLDEADPNTPISRYRRIEGLTSTDIRMVAQKFTEQTRGRMFAFFRHPYYIHLSNANKGGEQQTIDNPMARMILNQPTGEIDFKGLGTAKKVIREKCVVGLLDTENIDESIKRISSYFGWGVGNSKSCTRVYRSELKLDPKGELMHDESKSWELFFKKNDVDLQLYEFARTVFRAQKQTIIPRDKQISSNEADGEEKEDG